MTVLALISCTGNEGPDRVQTAGVSFEVPPGWSLLSSSELEDRHSTVETMVGTEDRAALAFAMEIRGLIPKAPECNPFGQEAPTRLVGLATGLEGALSRRYSDLRIVRRGVVRIDDEPAVEIVYEGREGDDAMRWRRVVLASPDAGRVFMFGFSCPMGEDTRYGADLQRIESSLRLNGS